MILRDSEGFIQIANWEKYQSADKLSEIREQNRLRKQKQRKTEKMSRDCHVTVTDEVTGRHATEEEGEEEGDGEGDTSFIHSIAREEDRLFSDPEYRRKYLGGIGKNVVFLSDEQMSDLLGKTSLEEFNHYVGVVADNELKGHHYTKKTHYEAIIDMVIKDRKVRN